jgi:uncharacterized membrane protein YsdA (DUF1294 family)
MTIRLLLILHQEQRKAYKNKLLDERAHYAWVLFSVLASRGNVTLLYIVGVFAFINLMGYFTMGIDKDLAVRGKHRVPEKRIWTIAWLGGAIGIYVGLRKFRHKTKHGSFTKGLPVLIVINIITYLAFSLY